AANLRFNSPVSYAPTIAPELRLLPLHVFLYSGRQDRLTRNQAPFAQELRGLGVVVRTAEPPGVHDWRLWRAEMPTALRDAGRPLRRAPALRPPPRRRPSPPPRPPRPGPPVLLSPRGGSGPGPGSRRRRRRR